MGQNVYLLSDGEYMKKYPAYNTLDMKKFYTVVLMEQDTTVNDVLGDGLYEELLNESRAGTVEGDMLTLLDSVQQLLVYCVSKSLIEFKDGTAGFDKDTRSLDLAGKINFIKTRIRRIIDNSTELQVFIDDTYDSTLYNDTNIHFWS